ncbi:hypothetical protein CCMA1212_004204 [Trichoderma ghanense]|uniref:Uncharacterized protein n=1 Tax=Trichoderma ghanense TaxID=65468 RepID=A0ABY2H654_9HYPO
MLCRPLSGFRVSGVWFSFRRARKSLLDDGQGAMTWCSFPRATHQRQARRGSEGTQEAVSARAASLEAGGCAGLRAVRIRSRGRVEVEAANMTFRGEERGSRAG